MGHEEQGKAMTAEQFTATKRALLSELEPGFTGQVVINVPRDRSEVAVQLKTAFQVISGPRADDTRRGS